MAFPLSAGLVDSTRLSDVYLQPHPWYDQLAQVMEAPHAVPERPISALHLTSQKVPDLTPRPRRVRLVSEGRAKETLQRCQFLYVGQILDLGLIL